MTKVRFGKLSAQKPRGGTKQKTVRALKGEHGTTYVVDSNSKSSDADLVRVFKSNVNDARQANTAIFGLPDGPKD